MADTRYAKMLSQLGRLQKRMEAAPNKEEIKLNQEKISALIQIITEHAVPLIQDLTQVPNAEQAFDGAYLAKKLDDLMRLESPIDARIGKVLARLVNLKEFKRTPAGGADDGAHKSQ
jgi:hypothetical protein